MTPFVDRIDRITYASRSLLHRIPVVLVRRSTIQRWDRSAFQLGYDAAKAGFVPKSR